MATKKKSSFWNKYDSFMENTKKRIALITGIFTALTALITAIVVFKDQIVELFPKNVEKYTMYILDASTSMSEKFPDAETTKWQDLEKQIPIVVHTSLSKEENIIVRSYGGECGDLSGNSREILSFGKKEQKPDNRNEAVGKLKGELNDVGSHLDGSPTLVNAILAAIDQLDASAKNNDLKKIVIFAGSSDACKIPNAYADILDLMQAKEIEPNISFIGMGEGPDNSKVLIHALNGNYLGVNSQSDFNKLVDYYSIDSETEKLQKAINVYENSQTAGISPDARKQEESIALYYFKELADNDKVYGRDVRQKASLYIGRILGNGWFGVERKIEGVVYYEKAIDLGDTTEAKGELLELLRELISRETDSAKKSELQAKLDQYK